MHDATEGTGRRVALSIAVIALAGVLLTFLWVPSDPAGLPAGEAPGREIVEPPPVTGSAGFAAAGTRTHDTEAPLLLTVPRLKNLRGAEIPTAAGTDEKALRDHAGVHVRGTGYPWQEGSNVYIAGHRIGYPGTPSSGAFYDLERLEEGDEVILGEPNGETHLYVVYETLEVGPREVDVTLPVPGKSIVSLQTCTLPDYSRRLIVRAEKVD